MDRGAWGSIVRRVEKNPIQQKQLTTHAHTILSIHCKEWYWSSNTLVTWCKELTHWKRPWCWERLRAGGEGGDRGWDGWTASPTQWTWVWANSGRQWRTGRPGVLQPPDTTEVAKSRTQLSSWTTATTLLVPGCVRWSGCSLTPTLLKFYGGFLMWPWSIINSICSPSSLSG